ncbi:MAG: hypothetical protein C5B48_01590 [Candidatus Rokuibacteriota bacterium]|nr:MAG: hypothetical protein C5B48_01590 [Candidatus Rokubacteria bacterium]
MSRAGRRRATRDLQCARWSRPARAQGSRFRSELADGACGRRHRRPRRPGLQSARRWRSRRPSLGRKAAGRVRLVAETKPFRAVRYDERRAGPLESLVAPPYDVLSSADRHRYLASSPYNVVHLTLPDDEAEAAGYWNEWQEEGVLVREDEPASWWLAQDYVGPDGLSRTREGLVVSLRAEPYQTGAVLPHERTHSGPKEGRLRLLRALRAHVEPIFLLYDGQLSGPEGKPFLEVELDGVRNRLWRAAEEPPAELARARFLIADGHHRYETALAFHAEDGSEESAWLLAVVVPTEQEGLTIFPTHRIVQGLDSPHAEPAASVEVALASLPSDRAGAVLYRVGEAAIVEGEQEELDAALVERLRPHGVSYTPRAEEAIAAVDRGEAEAAFLLRAPTVEQVRATAERGETLPQKSTYFYPKLPSGLLFLPL